MRVKEAREPTKEFEEGPAWVGDAESVEGKGMVSTSCHLSLCAEGVS